MRKIKFRAWHKKHQHILYVYEINFEEQIAKCRNIQENSNHTYGFIDIELMEFTGLEDKSGKEIWEGDIVNWTVLGGEICQIRYKDSAFLIEFRHFDKYQAGKWVEVIGNIHENPDLIEDNDDAD